MGLFSFLHRGRKLHSEQKKYIDSHFQSIHRHIDFLHDDLFVLLKSFLSLNNDNAIELLTDYPVAYESSDHLSPLGTINDNTRCPKFFWKCEKLFPNQPRLRFLDLGCSSGGLILDALLRGHLAIGLEGSDASLKEQRAQWRIIADNLFTCDITKRFLLKNRLSGERQRFDVVTMWDVLEHISENDLSQLLKNIRAHLDKDGIFVGSICKSPALVEGKTGVVDLHVTKKPLVWWETLFAENGFEIISPFEPQFMPRGGHNPPQCYMAPRELNDDNFGIAVRKKV